MLYLVIGLFISLEFCKTKIKQLKSVLFCKNYFSPLTLSWSVSMNNTGYSFYYSSMVDPKKLYKGTGKIIGFHPTNQNTLYLLSLFYSDVGIITVFSRPAICTLIGWVESSCLFHSMSGFFGIDPKQTGTKFLFSALFQILLHLAFYFMILSKFETNSANRAQF